ncbi:peptidoglycan DD-metalloendopeptidase family protein [Tenacibaculum sp. MEBiC06402]|uniref:peptidoglycan DD-metalloendopeptidase family protein n=1 Tax=unclassified Tenacibaculum TaxID=2635139 RepID=UPI003B9B99A8
MNNYILFTLKVTIVFTVLFTFYKLFFSRNTFHKLNRILLLLIIPCSIFIALTKTVIPIQNEHLEIPSFVELGYTIDTTSSEINIIDSNTSLENPYWLFIIYILGVVIYMITILKSIFHIHKLKKDATAISDGKYKLMYSNTKATFTCFNLIFIPKELQNSENNIVIEHEKKHVDFNHTLDLVLIELFIALFWFNPIGYLYRKSLKSIHEYQADESVLTDNNISIYQYLSLLKQEIEKSTHSYLYSYFGHPILKNRIKMITTSTTRNIHKLKYLILIPVIFLTMVSFTKENNIIRILPVLNDTKPSISPVKNFTKKDITAKYGPMKHPILKSLKIHNGIDIRASIGTPILATADGVIASASDEGNWGNLVIIKHENGFETLYAHLNSFNCKKNQKVKKGEIIGYSGETGKVTGPHLHYSIKQHGNFLNPLNFID